MLSRKYHNTLHVCGIIVIVFSAWGVIRNVAFLFLSNKTADYYSAQGYGDGLVIASYVISVICMVVDFLLRLYVGKCAMAEGRGKQQKMKYVVLAILMICMSIISIILLCVSNPMAESKFTIAVSVIVEATCAANLCELVYSAVKVKKIHKETA